MFIKVTCDLNWHKIFIAFFRLKLLHWSVGLFHFSYFFFKTDNAIQLAADSGVRGNFALALSFA